MTDKLTAMRKAFITDRVQMNVRKPETDPFAMARDFQAKDVTDVDRAARRMIEVLECETPVTFAGERIAFTRTVTNVPELFTPEEMERLSADHWIHEKGDVCNISVDYTRLLSVGLDAKRAELESMACACEERGDGCGAHYHRLQIEILSSIQSLSDRYRAEAEKAGNLTVARTLSRVPARPPESFLEALQMFRILHYAMWCSRSYHNTVGRFDQYMYRYMKADMDSGVLDRDSALDLLEEFFLTFNRDSDLYPGMQQGDNGQSMVLGGLNMDGSDSYNELSELCLRASLELRLIDPKINLRVHKNTPNETYVLGTQLTKQGLGFPQYSNDDVVIPGLLNLGYSRKDAYNYVVAACWEFIIPGAAMDIPNIAAMSFVKAIEDATFKALPDCADYAGFEAAVHRNIVVQVDALCADIKNVYMFPSPYLSLMMEDCTEQARDVSLGCRYNNYGFHGTGLATAADSMVAVKRYVFEGKSLSPTQLLQALNRNFEGDDELCAKLRFQTPKMGNNDPEVDGIAVALLDAFADAVQGRRNDRGGLFRAGTGSAMYYIWHSKDTPATPDGRHAGEGIPANYSPSLFSRCAGPVSILQSFARPNLRRVVNGGPLTLELHDTVFRTDEAIGKVAVLVKSFMDMGGHQLQLNAVNRDTMLDAQLHPENYRNLIVRVWGWSGYFVELDKEYQDHILKRMELTV